MFDDLIKKIEEMDGKSISIPLETDPKGYLDKQCPSENCKFLFKVNAEDWGNLFRDEAVWCPLCKHEAPADQWFTIKQLEHAKEEAFKIFQGEINKALRTGANKFNRKQPKNSFLSVSVKVKGGHERSYSIPAKATEEMQLEIKCERCSSRFAVIGSAFFCPACGHNSVTNTFSDSLRKIKAKKDNLDSVREALSETTSKDEIELVCRSLLETCISDGVTAFQKYCEGLYVDYADVPFNAFQNLERGSQLWLDVINKDYNHWLSNSELANLKILFNKRHILLHNEGIVDSRYIENSGDTSYVEGQRIIIKDKDIVDLVEYLTKLGAGLKEACLNN